MTTASPHEAERAALLARLRDAARTAAAHAHGAPLGDTDAGAADVAETLAAVLVHGLRPGALPRLLCALSTAAADTTAPVDSAELWARHALNRRAVPAALACLAGAGAGAGAGAPALASLYVPWAAGVLAETARAAQEACAAVADVAFALTMTGRASSVVTVDFRKKRRRRRRVACAVIDAGEGEEPEGVSEAPGGGAAAAAAAAAAATAVDAALAALGAAVDGGTGAAPPFPLALVEDGAVQEGGPDAVPEGVEDPECVAVHKAAEEEEAPASDAPDVPDAPEPVEEVPATVPPEPEEPQVVPEPEQEQVPTEVEPEATASATEEQQQEEQQEEQQEDKHKDKNEVKHEEHVDHEEEEKEVLENDSPTTEKEQEQEQEREEEDEKECVEAPDATAVPAALAPAAPAAVEVETAAPPVVAPLQEDSNKRAPEDTTEKEMEARAEMMQRVVRTFVGGSLVIADYDQDDTKRTISQIVEARLRAAAESAADADAEGKDESKSEPSAPEGPDAPEASGSKEREVLASREPPASWTPLVTEVHFYVPEGGTVADQDGRCYLCGAAISAGRAALNRGRYCHYTGRFFCRRCFGQGWRSAILGRVVYDWDFRERPVNRQSAEFLRAVACEPVIDVSALNPRLYATVPLLQDVRLVRRKLGHLRDYIACCPRLAPDDECRVLLQRVPSHYATTTEMYSLDDLRSLSAVLARLLAVVQVWLAHATTCALCTQKGFYCELCHADTLIYPYQVHDVVQCPQCRGVFHRACFEAADVCPKCLRTAARLLSSSHDRTTPPS